MVKRLFTMSAARLVLYGRKIVSKLNADSRLAETARSMGATQNRLEGHYDHYQAAVVVERDARARRDEAHRVMVSAARGFGFAILNITGNHHDLDPYVKFFPFGYGNVTQLKPEEASEFCREVLVKLEGERDATLVGYREKIESARTEFVSAQEAYLLAVAARKDAFAALQAEKREWTRGVARAQALAESECYFDPLYVKFVFAPVRSPRRKANPAEEPEVTPADAQNAAPQAVPSPMVTPVVAPRQEVTA